MKSKKIVGKMMMVVASAFLSVMAMSVPASAATPTISNVQKSIFVGRTVDLNVSGGTVKTWSSSNSSVATVNSKGVVTGKQKGTIVVTAKLASTTLKCTVNVRSTQKSQYLTNAQMNVMLNILGAVETGGQVYGQRDYADFTSPGASSPSEYSCTAGAYQEYGENLRQLLLRIKKEYPATFKKYDTAGIAADLTRTWYDSTPYKVYKGSKKANAISNIISTKQGQVVQDYRAMELIDSYIGHIKTFGVTNVRTALLLAECEHLGGSGPIARIVNRTVNKNNFSSTYASLMKDQLDTSNSYQIGDKIYQTRHEKCKTWILANIGSTAKLK